MSQIETPQERAGLWAEIGDALRRIARLEAVAPPTGDGGLQYNSGTYGALNVGDYLNIEATEYVYLLVDAGSTGPGGNYLELRTADTAFQIGPDIIDGFAKMFHLTPTTHLCAAVADTQATNDSRLLLQGDLVQTIRGASGNFTGGTQVVQWAGETKVILQPGAGGVFEVWDHNGNPKIRWTEGTVDLHIPTGGTIVADL